MFWKTKAFKVVELEWYEKLESTGFKDAETQKGERVLKQRATNSYRQANELERRTRLEYYLLLGNHVNNTEFPCELEKVVMNLRAEGYIISEIVKELIRLGTPRTRLTIRRIIRRWEAKWNIRKWSLKQRYLRRHTR